MKKVFFIFIVLFGALIVDIPEYVELNNLAIIEGIGINYKDNKYTIILKEVIPKKDENGINYEYKYYEESSSSFENSFTKILESTNKKIYLEEVKVLITNCDKSNKFTTYLDIKPEVIIHNEKNIKKELVKH